ncbi:PepSY-like domain-containing protein [Brumimicrobium oceani]|uniref:Putative beta-lactamase-inhibitor-like PepSY-like domain-containing protein n=1 Tax=Brumimicrobium oceani TaxID=2100725 RepID=A0A2U2XAW4_9FLAO|nr:PepSY-like domain-containing protein [Brumimicrobium oceani]PWH84939.1 hypothetical protein DIT68_12415 [Brumimicrobium oceani]
MKTRTFQLLAIFIFGAGTIFAQDIPESQVPSVILNNFKKEFPKAEDIEWELKKGEYNVEFEIGWTKDFEAWFSADGKLLRYTEDISEKELPSKVSEAVKSKFPDYRIDDVEKIVSNGKEVYKVELERGKEDFKVFFTKSGEQVQNYNH